VGKQFRSIKTTGKEIARLEYCPEIQKTQ